MLCTCSARILSRRLADIGSSGYLINRLCMLWHFPMAITKERRFLSTARLASRISCILGVNAV
ncbi:hypothetical protein SCLCIDRAFT_408685 [Scleroderma citrinum Foug A]|uniref:Uncharacterized protein n=1 Tax=Scleroderma citrinum Foug A TaxID=1036808 RepID=A0A0C2ZMI6_9AGAM|nr:hypothetical protein SCLCIDRAFT_408685 [Scleroderma citrinum Foug A]